jgi:flagellar biosynthesis protein FliQ
MEYLLAHVDRGIYLALLLSMPAVLLAAALGLIVGILQAVTQVQEQTIAAAPKILGVFLLLVFGGGLMMNAMGEYMRESFALGFQEIPAQDHFVVKNSQKDPAFGWFTGQPTDGMPRQ